MHTADYRFDLPAFAIWRPSKQANLAIVAASKGDDARRTSFARSRREKIEIFVVAVEYCHGAWLKAGENFRLGLRHGIDIVEKFGMDRLNIGDQHDMWAREAGKRSNFTRLIHAELEHAERGFCRQAREAQRRADVIV